MFSAGCLLSWYLVGRDPMPRRASTRTTLIVLVLAAGQPRSAVQTHVRAHLLPHGGGTADQIRAGFQIMFYGGDVIDVRTPATAANSPTTAAARSGPSPVDRTVPELPMSPAPRPAAMTGTGNYLQRLQ